LGKGVPPLVLVEAAFLVKSHSKRPLSFPRRMSSIFKLDLNQHVFASTGLQSLYRDRETTRAEVERSYSKAAADHLKTNRFLTHSFKNQRGSP
jgi:hypothetical protein